LLDYLREQSPDALCLQEIKCVDELFPRAEIEDLGYNVATHGQKGFNGVAILAKRPFEVKRGLPGDADDLQARYIEAVIPAARGVLRLACIYLPNGNPAPGEKYAYKLAFMDRLIRHARKLLAYEEPLALAGDFNVIPEPRDAAHPEQWTKDALFLPETRARFLTPSGTIRGAAGSATTASASTMSCCRRRRPTGSRRPPSTRTCAGARRPPIMSR
jgi:exodeoxyribonuclease-3